MHQELLDLAKVMDDETTRIAGVIDELSNEVKTGMNATEVAEVKTAMTAVKEHLIGIGKNPNQPIPPGPTPSFKKK